jgi:hypothetical protein
MFFVFHSCSFNLEQAPGRRFFPNGQVLSLLANEEHSPQQVIPLLKYTLRMKVRVFSDNTCHLVMFILCRRASSWVIGSSSAPQFISLTLWMPAVALHYPYLAISTFRLLQYIRPPHRRQHRAVRVHDMHLRWPLRSGHVPWVVGTRWTSRLTTR